MNNSAIIEQLIARNIKTLARTISLVENEAKGYDQLLLQLPAFNTEIIGITGPPGAGKSTLVDALIAVLIKQGKRIAVLCVDPSSSFHSGALLGDRIRMSQWYSSPSVFIRSLATRGNMGGLTSKIIEITDVIKIAGFDYIIIETIGVGQSEIDIAALADTTIVVLVPEAGDEIQAMKAGLMEIADIFVVNKADRPGTDIFMKNLNLILMQKPNKTNNPIPVIKTVALQKKGIQELVEKIFELQQIPATPEKKYRLLAEKCFQLIQKKKMEKIHKSGIIKNIRDEYSKPGFNLYRFAEDYAEKNN